MLSNRRTRLGLLPLPRPHHARCYHDAKAILVNLSGGEGPTSKEIDIKIGNPSEAYVMFMPEIGSILAGSPLPDGREVPLTFFHSTKHFARGPAPECARLELPVDLPHPDASDTTEATLFRFGLCCTIALNGTDCEIFTRLASTIKTGPGSTLDQLKDM